MEEWKTQIKQRICSIEDLPQKITFNKEETSLPFAVTPYYLSLAGTEKNDPILRQMLPSKEEQHLCSYELEEPLGEDQLSPLPHLVHRYKNRCVFLATDFCAAYCRHCFRRNFTAMSNGPSSVENIKEAAAYLKDHLEVTELLISGGDPLTMTDREIKRMLDIFRQARPSLVIRLGTRIPVVLPQRITEELADLLAEYRPIWVFVQFNHPVEVTAEAVEACDRLIRRGIPVLNQSVLLRGVNDSVLVLSELSRKLVAASIKPYYLFQGDLAAGTSHFRVPLERGLEIVRQLRLDVSGVGMPVYAVDLPGGGGKIPLTPEYFVSKDEDNYYFKSQEGRVYAYPAEKEG